MDPGRHERNWMDPDRPGRTQEDLDRPGVLMVSKGFHQTSELMTVKYSFAGIESEDIRMFFH